jgi:hypothetical protein
MKAKNFLREFCILFVLAYLLSLTVSYLYTLLVHGIGIIDWNGSLRFGILLGIIIPASRMLSKK